MHKIATFDISYKKPGNRWGGPTVPPTSELSKASVRLPIAQRKRFPRVTAVTYMVWWHCNQTNNKRQDTNTISDASRDLYVKNCGQTAADRYMVTIDSLQELVITLFNGTIADVLFSHNTARLA